MYCCSPWVMVVELVVPLFQQRRIVDAADFRLTRGGSSAT